MSGPIAKGNQRIMSNSRSFGRLAGVAAAAAATLVAVVPSMASAAGATQVGAVLTIVGTSNADLIELDMRADGVLEVKNAPGITTGTTFVGVTEVRIYTGSDPDTIDLLVESSLKVHADTGTNADSVKAEVLAGTTGTVVFDLFADTSTNADSVNVLGDTKGANLDVSVMHDMSTNDDVVFVEMKGEGNADWMKAKLRTRSAVGNDIANMSITSDATNVYVDMGADIQYSTAEWNLGTPYVQPPAETSLVVDHKAATGAVHALLSMASPKATVELKGQYTAKIVNGRVTGDGRDNSLTVFTEGPSSGSLVTDGSYGFDVCNTTVGTRVSCEAF